MQCIAVEHHVQYRKAAMLDDDVILRTWLYEINALYSSALCALECCLTKLALYGQYQMGMYRNRFRASETDVADFYPSLYQPIDPEIDPFDLSSII